MSLGLIICAIAFHYLPRDKSNTIIANGSNAWAILVLVSMVVYVMFYALGIGNVPWVSQSELFPMNVRGFGTGWATACNWGGNLIISSTYLSLSNAATPTGAFGFFAGLCLLGWLFVIFFFPELNGFTIEEVGEILQHGFGIKEAKRRRAEMDKDELWAREHAFQREEI